MIDAEYSVQGRNLIAGGPAEPVYISSFFDGVSKTLIVGNRKSIWFPNDGRFLEYDLEHDFDEKWPHVPSAESRQAVVDRLRAFDAYQRLLFK